jgi:hypothetical protein
MLKVGGSSGSLAGIISIVLSTDIMQRQQQGGRNM